MQNGNPSNKTKKRAGEAISRRRVVQIGAMLLTAPMLVILAACGSGSGGSNPTSPPSASAPIKESNPAFAHAQELFTTNKCISCHGIDLEGKAGPKTNLQKIGSIASKEQIEKQIKNGGGGMPGYKSKLTDEEIGLLSEWLSSKK